MPPLDCSFALLSPEPAIRHCVYCCRQLDPPDWQESVLRATRDHVWPHALRASRPADLLPVKVWACYTCNHLKGDLLPHIWHAFMRDTPHWWTCTSMFDRRRDALRHYYDPVFAAGIKDVAIMSGLKLCRRARPHPHTTFLDAIFSHAPVECRKISEQCRQVSAMLDDGIPITEIAEQFGLTYPAIRAYEISQLHAAADRAARQPKPATRASGG